MKNKIKQIDHILNANQGASKYYFDGMVNIKAVLKIIRLLKENNRKDVVKAASEMGINVSDHTIMVIEAIAYELERKNDG